MHVSSEIKIDQHWLSTLVYSAQYERDFSQKSCGTKHNLARMAQPAVLPESGTTCISLDISMQIHMIPKHEVCLT